MDHDPDDAYLAELAELIAAHDPPLTMQWQVGPDGHPHIKWRVSNITHSDD